MIGTYHCIMSYNHTYFTWLLSRRKTDLRQYPFTTSFDPYDPDSLLAVFIQGVRLADWDQDDMESYRLDVYELDDEEPGRQVIVNYHYPSLPNGNDDQGG